MLSTSEIIANRGLLVQDETESAWITEEYDDSSSSAQNSSLSIKENIIATTWKDGPYLLVVKISSSKPNADWYLKGKAFISAAALLCICVTSREEH